MESNWFQRLFNSNGERKVSPLVLVFAGVQLMLIIIVVWTLLRLNDGKVLEGDAGYDEKMPELVVKNLKKMAPDMDKDAIEDIQKKIFTIVSKNTDNINVDKIEAEIREDDISVKIFNKKTKYLNMLIDIPSLKQTYEVFYGSNATLDPEVATFVICPEKEDIIYEDFKCNSSDSESVRKQIVPTFLKYFKYSYFSVYPSSKTNKVIINPSVTYNNDEATKTKYIEEVKGSIASLGISPDNYEYYVRTAADVNYENPPE